jgi:hypothetical protein
MFSFGRRESLGWRDGCSWRFVGVRDGQGFKRFAGLEELRYQEQQEDQEPFGAGADRERGVENLVGTRMMRSRNVRHNGRGIFVFDRAGDGDSGVWITIED